MTVKQFLQLFTASAMASLWLAGCASPTPVATSPAPVGGLASAPKLNDAKVTIATFNIQNFGVAKEKKPDVMLKLREIVRRFDLLAVQEISNPTVKAPATLLESISQNDVHYGLAVSTSTGRQPDDKASQESYGFYWNRTKFTLLSQPELYDDSAEDLFQREPYVAHFGTVVGNFTFVIINVHTAPKAAVAEIAALHKVVQWAHSRYPAENDFIVVGDFNASGTYATPAKLDSLTIRGPEYQWLVPDDSDTTLAASDRAYDRIVITQHTIHSFTQKWGVLRDYPDPQVSDHFPVWAEFHTGRDF
jgi:endonuclease/exonuclease/phosphatase family metal-dependent hydrolase